MAVAVLHPSSPRELEGAFGGSARTIDAASPEREFVAGKLKAWWQHAAEPAWARINIKHAVARLTMKMVMVLLGDRCGFIAIGLPGNENWRDLAVV